MDRLSSEQVERFVQEKRQMVEAVNSPGMQLLMQKLHEESNRMTDAQINIDPFLEPDKIIRAQMFRLIVDKILPEKIEALVNFDPDGPQLLVSVKHRWSIFEWFKPRK